MSESQRLLAAIGEDLEDSSQLRYVESTDEYISGRTKKNGTTIKQELNKITSSSIPLAITFFLQYSLSLVSIFAVGRKGSTELAAISLASMTFNITSSIFTGMSTCLETLCSQAYGAQNYPLVGLYFQKCLAMLSLLNIPIVLLWWFSNIFLKYVVTDPELAIMAQSYLRVMSFSTPAIILFETGKRFLQAQNIFVAGQYALLIVAPINIVLNYVLVWDKTFGIGFLGAPLATTISYWMISIFLFGYAYFIEGSQCWYGLHIRQAFKDWGHMATLAINGTAMMLSEFFAFEILTMASARFGTETLAAQSIGSTLATVCYQVPFSFSVAGATRIAILIGAGKKLDAIVSTRSLFIVNILLSAFNFFSLFLFREWIVSCFTKDEIVTQNGITILTILAINQVWDCPNVLCAGILRAQARQQAGSKLNLVAYYIIAVPLALYLGFKCEMGVKGLWIGLGVGIFFLAFSEFILIVFSDWNYIMDKAKERSS